MLQKGSVCKFHIKKIRNFQRNLDPSFKSSTDGKKVLAKNDTFLKRFASIVGGYALSYDQTLADSSLHYGISADLF